MNPTLPDLMRLAFETVRAPRDGARRVLDVALPREARWQALAAIVIVSVLLSQVTGLLAPGGTDILMSAMLANPVASAVIQLGLMVVMVFSVYWIGRAMGGQGSFDGTILLMAWMQFIMVMLQVAQTLSLILVPPLAGLIGILGLGLFFWLLTNFVAELHGFGSLVQVFLMIILSIIGIAFVLSVVLSIIGIAVPGA